MYCSNCGKWVDDKNATCTNCKETSQSSIPESSIVKDGNEIQAMDVNTSTDMGNLIIKGQGNDISNESTQNIYIVAIGIAGFIVALILISVLSNDHRVHVPGSIWGEIRHGVAFFGRFVLPANFLRGVAAIASVGFIIWGFSQSRSYLNSHVSVFEKGISGLSKDNEEFALKFSEISSVHSQNESGFTSININASGKVFQVYTAKCSEIVSEINKRREV